MEHTPTSDYLKKIGTDLYFSIFHNYVAACLTNPESGIILFVLGDWAQDVGAKKGQIIALQVLCLYQHNDINESPDLRNCRQSPTVATGRIASSTLSQIFVGGPL